MSLFDKNKDAAEEANDVEERAKKAVDAPPVPQELMQALEEIQQEWEIFQTRVTTVFNNIKNGAPKSATKKSLSHAKHASMCVRDAFKAFGRLSL